MEGYVRLPLVSDESLLNEAMTPEAVRAQLMYEDMGWRRISAQADYEFDVDNLKRIATNARVYGVANPLIRRGLHVASAYVWGQGVQTYCENSNADALWKEFMADQGNHDELFSSFARETKEIELRCDGNLFFALFTKPSTGKVFLRSIHFDEITDIVCNPNDRTDIKYYRREWVESVFDEETGNYKSTNRVAYYPDWRYVPRQKKTRIGAYPVYWDSPIMHVKVNAGTGDRFGKSELYSVMHYARAHTNFLNDWATLIKALSRIAFVMKSPLAKHEQIQGAIVDASEEYNEYGERNQNAGGTAITTDGTSIQALPKSGATIDVGSGKAFIDQVCAGLGIPYTILMGDAATGNLATAKTLDRPTELSFRSRQELWTSVYKNLFTYLMRVNVNAGNRSLGRRGAALDRGYNDLRDNIVLSDDVQLIVQWPSLLEHDVESVVRAIRTADDTGKMPPKHVLRLLLRAFNVDDIEKVVKDWEDELNKAHEYEMAAMAAQSVVNDAVGLSSDGRSPGDDTGTPQHRRRSRIAKSRSDATGQNDR